MYSQIYNNQSLLNTSVSVSSISANVGTGFFLTSAIGMPNFAVEFNTNSPLSADAIAPALTAYNAATASYALSTAYFASISAVPAMSALSAAALSNMNSAFYSVTSTTVTLTATINTSFSAYNYFNTDGTAMGSVSSGNGTILVDRTYIGDIVNFRTSKRFGWLATLGATSTLTLTANGANGSWGPEISRMKHMGYC